MGTSSVIKCLPLISSAHRPPSRSGAGHAWGALDACERTPLDNKSAVFKHITTVLVSIKDALREVCDVTPCSVVLSLACPIN